MGLIDSALAMIGSVARLPGDELALAAVNVGTDH